MPLTHGNYNYATACEMSMTEKSVSGVSAFSKFSASVKGEGAPKSKFINDKFKL
jgi:hypothetical protein